MEEKYFIEIKSEWGEGRYRCKLCWDILQEIETRYPKVEVEENAKKDEYYKQGHIRRLCISFEMRKAIHQENKYQSAYRGVNGISQVGMRHHLEKYHPEIKLEEQRKCKHEFVCKFCKKSFITHAY